MTASLPTLTIGSAVAAIKQGVATRLAKFAGYSAASPTTTTKTGSWIGTNPNSTTSNIQRWGMAFTAEMVTKDNSIAGAYLRVRNAYCRPQKYKPDAGDDALNEMVTALCDERWKTMGVSCSMQAAVARTLHIETPVRGDAGLIFWRDGNDRLRLLEFSADQLGEPFNFVPPRRCQLATTPSGELREVAGQAHTYFAGRYYAGADCIAYKIYERTNSWYGNPKIYSAEDVHYCVDPFAFRGIRGVTMFATVLQYMQKSEDLLQSALSIAQRQARTYGRVFNGLGGPDPTSYESAVNLDGRQTFFEKIPGGSIEEYYFNGDSAEFTNPTAPGDNVIAGVEKADEKFCIGLGMTYAFVISGEKLGGAPSRLDCNRSGKEIERITDDISRPCLDRIAYLTIMDAVNSGELPPAPNIFRGHWSFTNSPTADAYRDSMDDIKSVRAGQDSNSRVCGRYGTTFPEIMRDKGNETFIAYQMLWDVQKKLKDAGNPNTPNLADIIQSTDNPLQAAQAEQVDKGNVPQLTPGVPAKLSAFIGDIHVSDLPESTQSDIAKILGTNGETGGYTVSKYGMTVPELLAKADTHNLSTARRHIKYCTNAACSDEVHANDEKVVLLNNDRIVDGHHFLAKAEKGRVSKSLPVIDLSPIRHQVAKLRGWDESAHKRGQPDNAGEFGPGGGSAKKKTPDKPDSATNDSHPAFDMKADNKAQGEWLTNQAKLAGHKDASDLAVNNPAHFAMLARQWRVEHPRTAPPVLSEKAERAKASHHMVDAHIQRYAEEHNEPRMAKALGGVSFPDSEPIDIVISGEDGVVKHGIELKTVVSNKNSKITMKGDAIARKRSWERKNRATIHTVVIDDSEVFDANGPGEHDEGKRKIYYRRGYGSFRIPTMYAVKDIAELKTLIDTPTRKLPPAAK